MTQQRIEFNRAGHTAAYRRTEVMKQPAGTTSRYGIGAEVHEVTVRKGMLTTEDGPDVWDQTTVNGEHTGNRCGGRNALAAAYAAELWAMAQGGAK